jgi:hypothetical protein
METATNSSLDNTNLITALHALYHEITADSKTNWYPFDVQYAGRLLVKLGVDIDQYPSLADIEALRDCT